MLFRSNQHTGDRISEIGMGSAYLYEAKTEEAVQALRTAYDGGINYFDLAAGHGKSFSLWGEALGDVRKNVFYQIHFGAAYSKGKYYWSLDLDAVKDSVAWMLQQLKTDFIDYGFIHCQDEASDWETYRKHGISYKPHQEDLFAFAACRGSITRQKGRKLFSEHCPN